MIEQEWLECNEPYKLLRRAVPFRHRKSRLFAVACCRRVWHLFIDDRSRTAVEVAERFADGNATEEELRGAAQAAQAAHAEVFDRLGKSGSCIDWAAAFAASANALHGARSVSWMVEHPRSIQSRQMGSDGRDQIQLTPCEFTARNGLPALALGKWKVTPCEGWRPTGADKITQIALIRCIFGNPFRSVTFDPAWRTPSAVAIAQAIYNAHRFSDLPILADALEEAGCTCADFLNHCRSSGEHVRGCWPVDLVLGKE